ncbi:MAG TPA: YceI family protein [bacterium]|nr:YceI family protein [bacterium]
MKRFSIAFPLAALLLAVAPPARAEMSHFSFGGGALSMVKIEIPAPLETTKAQLSGVKGVLDVDMTDLSKTAGSIDVDLTGIKGYSFTDQDKNDTQTEHMKNWFEIGEDVNAATRAKNQFAKFTITKVIKADPPSLAKASTFSDDLGAGRKFKIVAQGDFTVHGVTKPKTVELDATLYDLKDGNAQFKDAQRVLMLRTAKPFIVSLKEHDVKPRDTGGKFLSTALKVVGLKLGDDAQVSLDLRAIQPKPAPAK